MIDQKKFKEHYLYLRIYIYFRNRFTGCFGDLTLVVLNLGFLTLFCNLLKNGVSLIGGDSQFFLFNFQFGVHLADSYFGLVNSTSTFPIIFLLDIVLIKVLGNI
jgi:hypothetical protein